MKQVYVTFGDKKVEKAFEELKEGKYESKQLFVFIERAISDLKKDPNCGIKLPKKLWPKTYAKYNINNLMKYDLPNGWRLIYTIKTNEVMILNVILEWFDHKEYERRFGY
jgi:Txe/YoeB family toxin of Txe-Axe toxin-antitoxin module